MNTQPQRQARLTLSEVQQAIQQLQEQGFNNPSIRQIYAALGHRGSFSKIMELKQQVLANKLPQLSNNVTYLDNNLEPLLANNLLDNTVMQLLANVEPQLWESLQTRLEEWWSKHNSTNQQLEDLQKQVQELTTALQEMYQLWQDSTQSDSQPSPPVTHEEVKATPQPVTTVKEPLVESVELTTPTVELPNPQQTLTFVSWAQQQQKQHNGSWKPVVEWLNQYHITTPKGQLWTPKSLSDFIRKKKLQLTRVKSPT